MDRLYVLVACEESQAETIAFRALGHYAYSCDLQACSKFGCPDWHIQGDVHPFLKGKKVFNVQSGLQKKVPRWDLIIAHPPCTYLCRLSSIHMMRDPDWHVTVNGVQHYVNFDRFEKMKKAREFFFECLHADAPFVAVENPVPMELADLPKPDCYASPSWYGSRFTKTTYYWLKNLPPLMQSLVYPDPTSLVAARRGKYRSRTEPCLALAIAQQWSNAIAKYNRKNEKTNIK